MKFSLCFLMLAGLLATISSTAQEVQQRDELDVEESRLELEDAEEFLDERKSEVEVEDTSMSEEEKEEETNESVEDSNEVEEECPEGTCSEEENPSEEKVGLLKRLANKLSFFRP
eukprot:GFUD01105910.1.p1 GENE.GFUD01105910.1~~GFUD01105910.1.p1  ORF type:complete len:115 (+),score=48.47 GFUD01105910.1:55-399(+)